MQPLPDPALPWPICVEGVYEIARSEALRLRAYLDIAGVPTIGWGETAGVQLGDSCTKEQADRWLCDDLTRRARAVRKLCTEPPSDNELAALVSLAYNIGLAAFGRSTVLRQHNAGNRDAAARAFGLWNKARVNGALQEVRGLTLRRTREAALYLTPDDHAQEAMPQAVAAESRLTASPIAQSGAVTVGAGGLAGLGAVADQAQQAQGLLATFKGFAGQIAEFVGLPPGALLAVVLVGAGLVVMAQRRKQRRDGWA